MKKLAIALLALVSCFQLEALYFGNIAEPEIIEEGMFLSKDNWMAIKTGYQGDFVWDRKMRAHAGSRGEVDRFQTLMNQGVVTINFADRVDFYGNVGTMSFNISHRPKPDFKKREYQSDDHFAWGYGARGIVFHWKNTVVGVVGEMQYGIAVPFKWESLNGETFDAYYRRTKIKYNEWQLGGSIAQRIEILTPYFGIQWSRVRASLKHIIPEVADGQPDHFKMNNRVVVGVTMGCTISMGSYFDLNVETRLIDQYALSAAANVKF
jgi:hypothetical protein